ncbi:DUF7853 family protein [Halopiger goleimassiliensis]|uniref:DUF7853 family protein n=1 Tax=Halopiger goleimassiliensis TaxID=1293048 RepID=UPI0006778817|nr:hypothetical protein [Halopiger goleimassiliensis]
MSSPAPEPETHEVTLSREEQWVVHHALTTRIDEAIDADEEPPEWALEALDAIEAGRETFTGRQATALVDLLERYLDEKPVPESDSVHGSAVRDRLEDTLESRA